MNSYAKSKIIFLITFSLIFALLPEATTNHSFIISNNNEISNDSNERIGENKNLQNSAIWTLSFIHIGNNWSLTEQTYDWCTGEGTLDNPYIIEDVEIDAGGIGSAILLFLPLSTARL